MKYQIEKWRANHTYYVISRSEDNGEGKMYFGRGSWWFTCQYGYVHTRKFLTLHGATHYLKRLAPKCEVVKEIEV